MPEGRLASNFTEPQSPPELPLWEKAEEHEMSAAVLNRVVHALILVITSLTLPCTLQVTSRIDPFRHSLGSHPHRG